MTFVFKAFDLSLMHFAAYAADCLGTQNRLFYDMGAELHRFVLDARFLFVELIIATRMRSHVV